MGKTFIALLVLLLAASAPGASAFAADGAVDDPAIRTLSVKTVAYTYTAADAQHAANGVALRNRTSGVIPLRGVRNGSTISKAYLYWNYSDASAAGAATSSALFNGRLVSGTKVADNSISGCWGGNTGSHTYRADVTTHIPKPNPNQDYEVVLVFSGTTSTTGQNPWFPVETQTKRINGATLVVVFKHSTDTVGDHVYIYDDLSGTEFSGTGTFTLTHPSHSGAGVLTMSGADGQANVPGETTTFNATQIAGPPVGNADWDGSAGWPLPQLWDVVSHGVTLSGTSSVVGYSSSGDCLVPVMFVIQHGVSADYLAP
jgi:hypothetical protein